MSSCANNVAVLITLDLRMQIDERSKCVGEESRKLECKIAIAKRAVSRARKHTPLRVHPIRRAGHHLRAFASYTHLRLLVKLS